MKYIECFNNKCKNLVPINGSLTKRNKMFCCKECENEFSIKSIELWFVNKVKRHIYKYYEVSYKFADEIGVSRATMNTLVNGGKNRFSIWILDKICNDMNLHIDII